MKGVRKTKLPLYLDEFMQQERNEVPLSQLRQICRDIALKYLV